MLQSMGLQRVGHDLVTEQRTSIQNKKFFFFFLKESIGKMHMEYMFISKSMTKGKGTGVGQERPL